MTDHDEVYEDDFEDEESSFDPSSPTSVSHLMYYTPSAPIITSPLFVEEGYDVKRSSSINLYAFSPKPMDRSSLPRSRGSTSSRFSSYQSSQHNVLPSSADEADSSSHTSEQSSVESRSTSQLLAKSQDKDTGSTTRANKSTVGGGATQTARNEKSLETMSSGSQTTPQKRNTNDVEKITSVPVKGAQREKRLNTSASISSKATSRPTLPPPHKKKSDKRSVDEPHPKNHASASTLHADGAATRAPTKSLARGKGTSAEDRVLHKGQSHSPRANSHKSVSTNKSLHQSKFTSLEILNEEKDGSSRRPTPSEIDAAAATVDDEDVSNAGSSASVPRRAAGAAKKRVANSPSSSNARSRQSVKPASLTSAERTKARPPYSSVYNSFTGRSSALSFSRHTPPNRASPSVSLDVAGDDATGVRDANSGEVASLQSQEQEQLQRSRSSNSPNSSSKYADVPLIRVRNEATHSSRKASTSPLGMSDEPQWNERAALVARVARLHEEIALWDDRLAPSFPSGSPMTRPNRGKYYLSQRHSAGDERQAKKNPSPTHRKQRSSSVEKLGYPQGDVDVGSRLLSARLLRLRQENEQLEALYAHYSTWEEGMGVQDLVQRAEKQLRRAQGRLKEVNALRRALETRDKRAAHTIEAVHRRMPPAEELDERELNEAISLRTSLLRTVSELKEQVKQTRTSVNSMTNMCTRFDEHVQQKNLATVTRKEYLALCAKRDSNAKVIEKHKETIAVYTVLLAQDYRNNAKLTANEDSATSPSRSSRATTPVKLPSIMTKTGGRLNLRQQAIAEYETTKADLLTEQKMLEVRKQELQEAIEDLVRRLRQRNEQIKANHEAAGLNYIEGRSYDSLSPAKSISPRGSTYGIGGARKTPSAPPTESNTPRRKVSDLAPEHSIALERKKSIREVLVSPVKPLKRTDAEPGASDVGAAAPGRKQDGAGDEDSQVAYLHSSSNVDTPMEADSMVGSSPVSSEISDKEEPRGAQSNGDRGKTDQNHNPTRATAALNGADDESKSSMDVEEDVVSTESSESGRSTPRWLRT